MFYVGDFMLNTRDVKPFKTYNEQLSILKARGMHFSDEEKALEILKTENYYRISGYWLTMRRVDADGKEVFAKSASFDNVMSLYYFDTALRKILMSATTTIETNLKAFVAYYHGQKYGPCGYMYYDHVEEIWKHASFMAALSKDLYRRQEEPFVRHHDNDLGGVYPIWVATEVCSFDQISKFYKNMLPADRLQIAKTFYNISSREYIESWLHCAVVARNMAAHGARFYNKANFTPGAMLPKHLKKHATSFFGYIYAIYQLLPTHKKTEFLNEISGVIEDHSYAITKHLGLPEGWKTLIVQGAKANNISDYPAEVRQDVTRYLEYGWEWRVIATMINRVHGYNFKPAQLRALHESNE